MGAGDKAHPRRVLCVIGCQKGARSIRLGSPRFISRGTGCEGTRDQTAFFLLSIEVGGQNGFSSYFFFFFHCSRISLLRICVRSLMRRESDRWIS